MEGDGRGGEPSVAPDCGSTTPFLPGSKKKKGEPSSPPEYSLLFRLGADVSPGTTWPVLRGFAYAALELVEGSGMDKGR